MVIYQKDKVDIKSENSKRIPFKKGTADSVTRAGLQIQYYLVSPYLAPLAAFQTRTRVSLGDSKNTVGTVKSASDMCEEQRMPTRRAPGFSRQLGMLCLEAHFENGMASELLGPFARNL